MAGLPVNVSTCTVTGRLAATMQVAESDPEPDVVPLVGKVIFTPSVPTVIHVASNTIFVPSKIEATLDGSGSFSVILVASDDPDLNPTNWTYTVSFALASGSIAPFSFFALSGQTIEITDITPVTSSGGSPIVRGETGPPGPTAISADAGNAAILGSDSLIFVPEPEGGGGGGAAAVQVTLDAADFFPDALTIPANATLVEVLPITDPISVAIEDADDGAGFILHLAGGASNVTFTNAYPEGTFEDEVWATVVRASGAWRVFTTDSGALANLSDVSLWGGQQDGDALLWNDGTQRWEAGTVPPPTTMKLRHLTDVDDSLDSADDGQTLVKQDGIWTAGEGAGGGGGLPVYFETPSPRDPGLYDGVDPGWAPHSLLITGNEEQWDQPLTPAASYGPRLIETLYLDENGAGVDHTGFDGMFKLYLSLEEAYLNTETTQSGNYRYAQLSPFSVQVYKENQTTSDSTSVLVSHDGIRFTSYTEATGVEVGGTFLHSAAPLLQRSPDGTIWEGTIDNSGVLTWAPQA